jgi:hypothetical protein
MPVVMWLAVVVILGGAVLVALGQAGEMAVFAADGVPLRSDEVTAADIRSLRLPRQAWGYQRAAADEALRVMAQALSRRDEQLAKLRQEVADLRASVRAELGPVPERADPGPVPERADLGPVPERADPGPGA